MKVLVTGGGGFIGAHLIAELAQAGHTAVSVDIRNEALLEDVRRPDIMRGLLEEHEPNAVIHLAGRVGRLFGEDDVAETIADNAGMTATVAKACGDADVQLVYASTSEVYGDCGNTVAYEAIQPRLPHNVYGLSKRWGEEACRLYAPDDLLILRFSMPYGPGLPWGRGRAAIINFLHQAIEREPIPVHRGAERSWCYVGDTVRAVRMLLEQGYQGAFNIGRDDDARPLRDVAKLACELVGAPTSLIEDVDAPARQTVVKRLATEKIRGAGWHPQVSLLQGMTIVRDWIQLEKQAERELVA